MKNYVLICAVALASCTGQSNRDSKDIKSIEGDTVGTAAIDTSERNGSYCFIHTEGTSNQDTTKVHFTINAKKVQGTMQWIPAEKDSRKGTLDGMIAGDEITAVWTYMQEGVQDSIKVMFKLSSDELTQKPLKVNSVSGRQETDNNTTYTLIYRHGDCSNMSTSSEQ